MMGKYLLQDGFLATTLPPNSGHTVRMGQRPCHAMPWYVYLTYAAVQALN